MLVLVPDVFLSFKFQKDRVKSVGAVGVEISPLPLTRHIAYTTACCYRTSRDVVVLSTYVILKAVILTGALHMPTTISWL